MSKAKGSAAKSSKAKSSGAKSSKAKKAVITTLVVLTALAAVVLVGARIYFRAPVSGYYKASEKAFKIPGLSDNMIPQGIDHLEGEGLYLVGGYQKDAAPSRVYRIDNSGKSKGYVVLGDEGGNAIAPHAGGLAANGEYFYIAGDEDTFVWVYRLADVTGSSEGTVVTALGKFNTTFGDDGIRADFMCFDEGRFIVGEFYRDPNYLTPETHVSEVGAGEKNRALALSFNVSDGEGAEFGLETKACEAYSLPDQVQGITVFDGKIWISQSYGTAISTIRSYDVSGSTPHYIETKDGQLPVYDLCSADQVSEFKAPPMAEEIVFVDGRLLIMCESASNKYIFGKLTGGSWCYSTDVNSTVLN